MPKENPKLEPKAHLTFYIFVYYTLCVCSWIALISKWSMTTYNMHDCFMISNVSLPADVWIVQRSITLWAERMFASIAAICYLMVSIVCILPVDIEYERSACETTNQQLSTNRYCSLWTLVTGMIFLLHAILTTEMAPENGMLVSN